MITWRTKIVAFCTQASTIGMYGFLVFLPCSIAFAQMCLGLLAVTFLVEASVTGHWRWPRTPFNRPLLAYLGLTVITTPFSVNAPHSLKGLDSLLIIAVFPLVSAYLNDRVQLKRWVGVLVGAMTVAALYGVLQHYLEVELFRFKQPISFLKHVNDDLAAPVRVSGFFSIYMTFAGQLSMMLPIICVLVIAVKSGWRKVCAGFALLLAGLALFWTYTRSGWLAGVGAVTVMGYLRGKKLSILFLLVLCLLSILLLQPELVTTDFSFLREKDEERIYTWITTLDMIKDFPLTGVGKKNYSQFIEPYRERRYGDFKFSSRAHAHNNLLQIMADSGIITGLCWLWLWVVLVQETYRTYRRMPETDRLLKWLPLGFLGSFVAFFVQGFFEYNWGDSESVMMLWLIIALALNTPFRPAPNCDPLKEE